MTEERRERKASPSACSRPHPNKRSRSDDRTIPTEESQASASTNSELQQVFIAFRDEIDDRNDRRERLIKTSRDITSLSKKVIFLLHRFDVKDFASAEPSGKARELFSEAETKLEEIISLLRQAAVNEGLGSIEAPGQQLDASIHMLRSHRYERTIGGGLEEFVSSVKRDLRRQQYIDHRLPAAVTCIDRSDLFLSLSPNNTAHHITADPGPFPRRACFRITLLLSTVTSRRRTGKSIGCAGLSRLARSNTSIPSRTFRSDRRADALRNQRCRSR